MLAPSENRPSILRTPQRGVAGTANVETADRDHERAQARLRARQEQLAGIEARLHRSMYALPHEAQQARCVDLPLSSTPPGQLVLPMCEVKVMAIHPPWKENCPDSAMHPFTVVRQETRQALEAHALSRRKEEAAAARAEAEWSAQPSKPGRPVLTQLPWSASTTTYNLTPELEVQWLL